MLLLIRSRACILPLFTPTGVELSLDHQAQCARRFASAAEFEMWRQFVNIHSVVVLNRKRHLVLHGASRETLRNKDTFRNQKKRTQAFSLLKNETHKQVQMWSVWCVCPSRESSSPGSKSLHLCKREKSPKHSWTSGASVKPTTRPRREQTSCSAHSGVLLQMCPHVSLQQRHV